MNSAVKLKDSLLCAGNESASQVCHECSTAAATSHSSSSLHAIDFTTALTPCVPGFGLGTKRSIHKSTASRPVSKRPKLKLRNKVGMPMKAPRMPVASPRTSACRGRTPACSARAVCPPGVWGRGASAPVCRRNCRGKSRRRARRRSCPC